ncbi:homoserine O-acetyltransferase family protein [Parapedobacter sp. DT-150]|uniref:homoserine O-acetyltransferase family protein n=1 Tax=Parapedobacter sp. DT-150 TaxID=3396162 RepID=UPI003F1B021B
MSIHTFNYSKTFKLENGRRIQNLKIAYHTYGTLNERKDNVVWVCHALTANADVFEWWPGLFGEKDLFNPKDYFIVCANIIGSPYGSTNPLSINPATELPYYLSFPQFSVRDLTAAHRLLADHLAIDKIAIAIGGSLGGQQALEWAIADPDRIGNLVIVATNAAHSPWGIAFNESQRLAISTDRTFYADRPDGGAKGLKAARSIALLSYRGYDTYGATQLESTNDKQDDFKASSYQHYQGEKLVKRFNAYSYWFLSKAMDSHNVGRGRTSIEHALRGIKAKTLVIGINTDLLFPVEEQQFLATHIPGATYAEISSFYGHDGFLIETKRITETIVNFLNHNRTPENETAYQQVG